MLRHFRRQYLTFSFFACYSLFLPTQFYSATVGCETVNVTALGAFWRTYPLSPYMADPCRMRWGFPWLGDWFVVSVPIDDRNNAHFQPTNDARQLNHYRGKYSITGGQVFCIRYKLLPKKTALTCGHPRKVILGFALSFGLLG